MHRNSKTLECLLITKLKVEQIIENYAYSSYSKHPGRGDTLAGPEKGAWRS